MSNRQAINDNMLDNVVGGNLLYTYNSDTKTGTIWINDKDLPNPTVYTFKDKQGMIDYLTANYNKYGDYGTIEHMIAANLIWE